MSKDERKNFVGQIILQNFKNAKGSDLSKNSSLDNFLDSGNCMTLFVFVDLSQNLHIDNHVSKIASVLTYIVQNVYCIVSYCIAQLASRHNFCFHLKYLLNFTTLHINMLHCLFTSTAGKINGLLGLKM